VPLKPRNLIDIKSKRADSFGRLSARLNLHSVNRLVVVPVKKILFGFVLIFSAAVFLFGSVYAPLGNSAFGAAEDLRQQQVELETELKALESEIDQINSKIEVYRRQGSSLQSEIDRLSAQVSKINLQIRAVTLSLRQLSEEISATGIRIEVAEENISFKKGALARLLQNLYEYDSTSVMEMMLANPSISDFFGNINDLVLVQENLRFALTEIVSLRDELVSQKETLSLQKADAEALRLYQEEQRLAVQGVRSEKDTLLRVTKGEEAKYKVLVQEKQKTAAEIRKQIFRLFGGGELSFEEAYNLARTAEQATGVRAALVLAVLEQESRLGRNVGQCSPQKAMHPTRDVPKFNQIINELRAAGELLPEPLMVSCPISAHGAYGGAMGPAQFIPSTWLLYQSSIANVTGNNPPNPWRNADAFVGTALYLRNSLDTSSCRNYADQNKNILPHQFLLERCAAAQYYSGGNWFRFRFAYGDPVVEKADQFQRDINVLTGSISSL